MFKYCFLFSSFFGIIFLSQLGCHNNENCGNTFMVLFSTFSISLLLVYIIIFVISLIKKKIIQKIVRGLVQIPFYVKLIFFGFIFGISFLNAKKNLVTATNEISVTEIRNYILVCLVPISSFMIYHLRLIINQKLLNNEYKPRFTSLESDLLKNTSGYDLISIIEENQEKEKSTPRRSKTRK